MHSPDIVLVKEFTKHVVLLIDFNLQPFGLRTQQGMINSIGAHS